MEVLVAHMKVNYLAKFTRSIAKLITKATLILLLVCAPVMAEKINFIGINSPPYAFVENDHPAGINVLWIDKVRIQLSYRSDIYVYPLKRAMREVQSNTASVLFGLARTAERESNFTWVTPMYEVKIGYVTLSQGKSRITENGHKFRAKYCVHAGSPMEQLLTERGETDVISLLTDERCLDMLEQGMVSVWFTEFNVARYLAKQHQVSTELKFGKTLKSMLLYVAVAKNFPAQNLQKLEQISDQAKELNETDTFVSLRNFQ